MTYIDAIILVLLIVLALGEWWAIAAVLRVETRLAELDVQEEATRNLLRMDIRELAESILRTGGETRFAVRASAEETQAVVHESEDATRYSFEHSTHRDAPKKRP